LKLKDIATVITAPRKDYQLQDTDILMSRMGNDIGKIYYQEEKQMRFTKQGYFIIQSKQEKLNNILSTKIEDIKALAKGKAILQIFKKDLLEWRFIGVKI